MSAIFYTRISQNTQNDLQLRTRPYAVETSASATARLKLVTADDIRITIVAPDGAVVFENTASIAGMENHGNRPEIQEAFGQGEGEAIRKSDTIGEETYYFAVRLSDGYVLRTATTISSIWSIYARAIPVIVVALVGLSLVAYFAADRLSDSVVAPITSARPVEDRAVPYDELAPYAQTIAEQQRKIARDRKRLDQRSLTIDAIMANVEEGIVLFDHEAKVLSLNHRAQSILSVDESFEGRTAIELYRDLEFEELVRESLEGRGGSLAFKIGDKDYRFIMSPAENIGALLIIMDVTESLQAERYRREFSANVSHELKTPLTSIYGSAEMLNSGIIKERDQKDFYAKMMKESSRLISLVEDIMLLSQLDEKQTLGLDEKLDVAKLAKDVRDELLRRAEKRSISIDIKGEMELQASRSLIHELLYNLTDNAIKYNTEGGKVELELSETETANIILVKDSGIGISASDQERIFERFYRVDQSRSKDSGGTGLGLAIVKHIVLIHGGAIELESEMGKGTQFKIAFPRKS